MKFTHKCNKINNLILVSMLLFPIAAQADTWLNYGGISQHFGTNGQKFNEFNHGFGIETDLKGLTISTGFYNNSIYKRSHYVAIEKILFSHGEFGIGVQAGVVDGYYINDGGFFATILPTIRWDGETFGIRAFVIPPIDDKVVGAVAVQFRMKIGK